MPKMTKKTLYMCQTDFECELGAASDGVRVYPSIEALQKHQTCTLDGNGCGIVAVSVELIKVEKESDYFWSR